MGQWYGRGGCRRGLGGGGAGGGGGVEGCKRKKLVGPSLSHYLFIWGKKLALALSAQSINIPVCQALLLWWVRAYAAYVHPYVRPAVGWSDFALFAIFEKQNISAV